MSCGCGKKTSDSMARFMARDMEQLLAPTEWGPILWKYLHCLADKIGLSGSKVIDTDQANYIETMMTSLPLILPCNECQSHTALYLTSTPFPSLKGLYGAELRDIVRQWIFTFHNHVRTIKQQPILFESIDDYNVQLVSKYEYTLFIQSVAAATRQGWVRLDNWRKWYSNSERVRILTGNIVV